MDRIFAIAAKEQQNRVLQSILSEMETMSSDTPISKERLLKILDDAAGDAATAQQTGPWWDFAREKSLPMLVSDEMVSIRPMTLNDCEFYAGIRKQYSTMPRIWENEDFNRDVFPNDTQKDSMFFCVVESVADELPIGYIALKDTSADVWEFAIELDRDHCYQGIGPRSIRLFLRKIHEITGREQFRALVEADNLPCLSCMKKVSARLVGLRENGILKTDEERARFEDEHLDRIDAHMMTLAEELAVEPRKLLSHLLDLHIDIINS